MPMFDYKCEACGKIFDDLVSSRDTADSEIECPHCKEKKEKRLFSAPAIAVNGAPPTASPGCNPSSGFS